MWDNRPVHLEVSLPPEVAAAVEEIQRSDPEFLRRVLLYGVTRRSVFQQLNEGPPPHFRSVDPDRILDPSALA